mmetsp:Transcript_23743/g.64603  ORF Transcript_23743/g.64603 Transcript_23743/m.64603 type:complete len:408 (-) Transcript_23743:238-1461(-)
MEAFGGRANYDAFGARPKTSSNTYANGNNQNCGNVLSDTPTTRVAQAPGGRSSLSLGWGDADEGGGRRQEPVLGRGGRRQEPPAGGQARSPRSPTDFGGPGPRGEPGGGQLFSGNPQAGYAAGMAPQRSTSNAYASGANQNSGNVMSDVASTRVSKPPGGASSVNMSWGDQRRGGGSPEMGPPQTYAGADGYGQGPSDQASTARSPGAMRERDWPRGQASPRSGDDRCEAWGGPSDPQDGGRGSQFSRGSPHGAGPPRGGQGDQVFGTRTRPSSNSYANGCDQNCGNVMTDVPTTRVLRPPGGSSAMSLSWEDKPLASPQQDRFAANPQQDRFAANQEMRGQGPPQEVQRDAQRGARDSAAIFGQRPRVSSNTFASGADQNCGNVISDTPTTRVSRPPGGTSSLRLG